MVANDCAWAKADAVPSRHTTSLLIRSMARIPTSTVIVTGERQTRQYR